MKKHPVFVREFLSEFPEKFAPQGFDEAIRAHNNKAEGHEVTCAAKGPGGLYAGTQNGLYHMFGKRNVWHSLMEHTYAPQS